MAISLGILTQHFQVQTHLANTSNKENGIELQRFWQLRPRAGAKADRAALPGCLAQFSGHTMATLAAQLGKVPFWKPHENYSYKYNKP